VNIATLVGESSSLLGKVFKHGKRSSPTRGSCREPA
jgi:hypothetical protein